MRQLVPGFGESQFELIGILVEAFRDRCVERVHPKSEVRSQHDRGVGPCRIVGVGHGARAASVLGNPLRRSGRALGLFPLVSEECVEKAVVPLDGARGPRAFQPTRNGVAGVARAKTVLPTQSLLGQSGGFRFGADQLGRIGRAVGLSERVAAGNQGHGLFVIHRHATKGLANVDGGRQWIGSSVRSFGVHVDESHLDCTQRSLEFPVAAVALIAQPGVFGSPVDTFVGFEDVFAPAGEAVDLHTHRFEGQGAGEDYQVGPGDLATVLLLDWPEQPTGLVETDIVGPTIERREALSAGRAPAASVMNSVRARTVPGHPDEEGTVVAVVGRPPLLRGGHQRHDVLLQGVEVKALELLGVVE